MGKPSHDFHIIDPSPRPIVASLATLTLAIGGLMYMHEKPHGGEVLLVGLLALIASMGLWWKDVIREGIKDKSHTEVVRIGLRMGMALFILSEVMFFFAFFFSFFKAVLLHPGFLAEGEVWAADMRVWPPEGIKTFDPWDLPFLNTLILLLSGTTVTWAHHALLHGDRDGLIKGLSCTVGLGILFSIVQAYEYSHATFGFSDGIYASNFYMATGFHGFHVLIGTIFLAICLVRAKKGHFTPEQHLGFEFAAWYWHFVDVVWLFLFAAVYIWGS